MMLIYVCLYKKITTCIWPLYLRFFITLAVLVNIFQTAWIDFCQFIEFRHGWKLLCCMPPSGIDIWGKLGLLLRTSVHCLLSLLSIILYAASAAAASPLCSVTLDVSCYFQGQHARFKIIFDHLNPFWSWWYSAFSISWNSFLGIA